MAQEAIPRAILSDRLTSALRGRQVRAAIFTTFSFDPAFFEQEVVPILFDQAFSHMENLRLLQLEEALVRAQPIAIYYDRAALQAGGGGARLDVRRIGVTRRNGCFHPKLIAVLVEETNEKSGDIVTALVVAVMSANLTRSGWWENVECAEIMELNQATRSSIRDELRAALKAIRADSHAGAQHEALEKIDAFLKKHLEQETRRSAGGVLHPKLYAGQSTVSHFLSTELRLPAREFHLEVISPYFDGGESATLSGLIDELEPKSTTVYLPLADDATALCKEEFFSFVKTLPNARWGKLPADLLLRSKAGDDSQTPRFVHAKVYRLWSRELGKEYMLVGSVNLTGAAHSDSRKGAGNFEVAVLVQGTSGGALKSWLAPVDENYQPGAFELPPGEDELPEVAPPPITITFEWDTGIASYFWEKTPGAPPAAAVLTCGGVELTRIDPIVQGARTELPAEFASELRDRLRGTSFLEIAVDGREPATILVSEEGMAQKPSLLTRLTVAEILKYWSLLSPEQREAFLEKQTELLAHHGVTVPHGKPLSTSASLFDGFAGIFHAFVRLEEHVSAAIENKHEAEAVYRLFGKKYDSLPSLIEKVMEEKEPDPVNQYVTLLAAKQLVRRLESKDKAHVAFFHSHAQPLRQLTKALHCIDTIRSSFDFGEPEARQRFFKWFDERFLADAKRPAEET